MKELIARKVDRLGRIVIPKELRDNMRITHDDPLEIYVKDDNIVITKYNPIDDADGVAFLRNVDKLGRIVIPKELRDSMNIKYNDRLKIFIDFQNIVIKQCNKRLKYRPRIFYSQGSAQTPNRFVFFLS